MRYKIFDGGAMINTIVADEAFAAAYCAENGYTYEAVLDSPAPETADPDADRDELLVDHELRLTLLELGVN